ncbi:hypothetical protein S83_054298 [Arachis hypogaea]
MSSNSTDVLCRLYSSGNTTLGYYWSLANIAAACFFLFLECCKILITRAVSYETSMALIWSKTQPTWGKR